MLAGVVSFSQDIPVVSVPSEDWPPQWLIDLQEQKANEWPEVHQYETVVPKPLVELAEPTVIGTEEVSYTAPNGEEASFTADIIEEPQQPVILGHWEEEIVEEFVAGKWITILYPDPDNPRSFQSWQPQHKLVLHKMSWVSDEVTGVVLANSQFNDMSGIEFLTAFDQGRRIKFKPFIFKDEDETRGTSLRFIQNSFGYNFARLAQNIDVNNFLFQIDIKHKPQKYSGDGSWFYFAPASFTGQFKVSIPMENNTEFFSVAMITYWGASSFPKGLSIAAFSKESVYEVESPTNIEDDEWHKLEIEFHKLTNSYSFTIKVDNIITHDNITVENVTWINEPLNIYMFSQTGAESEYVSIDNLIISTL
jgi:hypothetical protein